MAGEYDSPTQQVINWIVQLFQSSNDLQDISWSQLPAHAQVTLNVPSGHVFAQEKSHNQHGFQDDYEYVVTMVVQIVETLSESDGQERKILFYEKVIEEILILNQQPNAGGDDFIDIPDLMSVEKVQATSSRYDVLDLEDQTMVDVLQMDITVDFVRMVTD